MAERTLEEDLIISKVPVESAQGILNIKRDGGYKILVSLISDNISESHPIFRHYEKEIGQFLEIKLNALRFTDSKGMIWWKIDVTPKEISLNVDLDDDEDDKGD